MTLPPEPLSPDPGERGRVSTDLDGTLQATVAAWDALLDVTEGIDLRAPSRKDGRTAARTLVVLGSWPEGRPLPAIRAAALAGDLTAEPLEAIDARVVQAHVADSPGLMRESLLRARDDIVAWAESSDVASEALLPVAGPLGVVPLGTLVAATAYQCAVAARDLEPAGVRAPDTLLAAGLAALIDTVGAVSAQQDAAVSLTVITPQVGIGTGARDGDWRTARMSEPAGPTLTCDA